MTDDAPQYWDAWESAFGGSENETSKLLCMWHIKKNWRANLQKLPADLRSPIWHRLHILLSAASEAEFRDRLAKFYTELDSCEGTSDFVAYFRRYYGQPHRVVQWAMWARRGSPVNTNMYIESFHKTLKYKFLEGKQNRRMDVLLSKLLDAEKWYLEEYAVMKNKGLPANAHRLSVMNNRHQTMLQLKPDGVTFNADSQSWTVESGTDESKSYEVYRCAASCSCLLRCRHCDVCPHMYSCTCPDGIISDTACKHAHKIHFTFDVEVEQEDAQEELHAAEPDSSEIDFASYLQRNGTRSNKDEGASNEFAIGMHTKNAAPIC